MNLADLPGALRAWAEAIVPALEVAPGHVERLDLILPMCEATIQSSQLRPDPRFEESAQRVAQAVVLVLVSPDDPVAASSQLLGIVDSLQTAALADRTLGQRVANGTAGNAQFAGEQGDPLRVEFDDGTHALLASLPLAIQWAA